MIGPLVCGTVRTADLDAGGAPYEALLGYRRAGEGTVDAALAAAWGAPALAGRRWRVLFPPSADIGGVRLVEGPVVPPLRPLRTLGWAALELLVADADAVRGRLGDGGAFRVLGEPRPLGADPSLQVRAFQVAGPSGEVLYLTQVDASPPGLDLPRASALVDRLFIAVLAVADLPAASAFAGALGVPAGTAADWTVDVLNDAFGLPRTTRHRLATLPLAGRCLLELDAYPPAAEPRPVAEGDLPPGIAMVTVEADDLAAVATATPVRRPEPPYGGRRAVTVQGPAGERWELIAR